MKIRLQVSARRTDEHVTSDIYTLDALQKAIMRVSKYSDSQLILLTAQSGMDDDDSPYPYKCLLQLSWDEDGNIDSGTAYIE